MVGSYSSVHSLLTRRNVMELFPHPPSPHTVIVILLRSPIMCLLRLYAHS